jgi:glycosyltransferase involved in cell wall biosynthesis
MTATGYDNGPAPDTGPHRDIGSDPLLLDVSRLVWRRWAGHLPTGIDRVCLAYLDRYAPRARAVLQWRGCVRALSPRRSARLFALLARGGSGFRAGFAAMLPAIAASRGRPAAGRIYLNVGHTGLDRPALADWIGATGVRPVFLLHDLIPLTHPEFCRAGEAQRHARRVGHVLDTAAGIIANSAATGAAIELFARARARAVPPILPAWIATQPLPAPPRRNPAAPPWFVAVGTIEGRKNHALLLQVWQRLARAMGPATPRLVLIGRRGWEADMARALLDRDAVLRHHVIEYPHADDAAMAEMVAGARALLMPSFAEGFGLPVVEALRLGTPVIASDLPVFREVAGTIPTFVDPTDGPGWYAAIRAFCDDGPDRARQVAALRGWRAPNWDSHFARVDPWLARIAKGAA